jgi:STE24 endopeptidase
MVAAAAMIAIALTQPAANAYSRKIEARADAFGLQETADPAAAISLQKRLTTINIGRPAPPSLQQFIFGTHPTPMQRIGMAETVKREQEATR